MEDGEGGGGGQGPVRVRGAQVQGDRQHGGTAEESVELIWVIESEYVNEVLSPIQVIVELCYH